MRLHENQGKLAILHADRDVREAAIHDFGPSFRQDPAIMPLAIQVARKAALAGRRARG